jgi:hypothetical protein
VAFVGLPFSITWAASTSTDVSGYHVYYGPTSGSYTGSGSPIDVGNVTTYLLTSNVAGQDFIALKTYDSFAVESTNYSNEIEMDVYTQIAARQASRGIYRVAYR